MTENNPGVDNGDDDQPTGPISSKNGQDASEQEMVSSSEQISDAESETSPTPEEQAMLDMAKEAIGDSREQPQQEARPEGQAVLEMAKPAMGSTSEESNLQQTPEEQAMLDLAKNAVGEVTETIASLDRSAASATPLGLPNLRREVSTEVPEEIALLSDVNLNVKIELGRTRMFVEDVLRLSSGAVVELDKLAGDPVDVIVNGRIVARGEVLVLNDSFCVRISEIIGSSTSDTGTR
jgi:flagellar motor switch protein FliN